MSKNEQRGLKLKNVMVESSSEDTETESDVPDLEARRRKQKGIVIREGEEVKDVERARKKKRKASSKDEQSTTGATGKQLQSITVEGSPTRSTAKTIKALNLPSSINWIAPEPEDRPWTPPMGYMCVYESYFKNAHLCLPIPKPIIEFCARKRIAMSQLTTVTLIELLGVIVFGAELGIAVDATFLEKTEKLIANGSSPGTFYTQAGFVRNKPNRINNWQTHYFFVEITEASVEGLESGIFAEWNRILGVSEEDKDQLVPDRSEVFERNRKEIKAKEDRGYKLYTESRISNALEKLRSEQVRASRPMLEVPWSTQVAASKEVEMEKVAKTSSSGLKATGMPTTGMEMSGPEQEKVATLAVTTLASSGAPGSKPVEESRLLPEGPIATGTLKEGEGSAGRKRGMRGRRKIPGLSEDLAWERKETGKEKESTPEDEELVVGQAHAGGKPPDAVKQIREDAEKASPMFKMPVVEVSDEELEAMFEGIQDDVMRGDDVKGGWGEVLSGNDARETALMTARMAAEKRKEQGEIGAKKDTERSEIGGSSGAMKRLRDEDAEKRLGGNDDVVENETIGSSWPEGPILVKKPRTMRARGVPLKQAEPRERENKMKTTGGPKTGKAVGRSGKGRSHHWMLEYRGEGPIANDPESCGRLLQQIPEIDDAFLGEEIDLNANYNEFAALAFQLVNSRNRASRGHEGVVVNLKKEMTELEEATRKLHREKDALIDENTALKTLKADLEQEKERRIAKEKELSDLEVDIELERLNKGRAETKLRVRTEEMEAMRKDLLTRDEEIKKLKEERTSVEMREQKIEEMRGELVRKDKEIGELKGELASRDELKKKILSLEEKIKGYQQEVVSMDRGCRMTLKRLLKEQAEALHKGYIAKNDNLRRDFAQYLKDREELEDVEVKLFQAEEALKILGNLKAEHGVAIPEFAFADLRKREAALNEEFRSMECEDFTPADLTLELPDEIGAYDVDKIDFKTAILVGEGANVVKEEEEEGNEAVEAELRIAMDAGLTPQATGDEGARETVEKTNSNGNSGGERESEAEQTRIDREQTAKTDDTTTVMEQTEVDGEQKMKVVVDSSMTGRVDDEQEAEAVASLEKTDVESERKDGKQKGEGEVHDPSSGTKPTDVDDGPSGKIEASTSETFVDIMN